MLQDGYAPHKAILFSGFLYKRWVQCLRWTKKAKLPVLSSQNDTQATSFIWATWHWKGAKELLQTQEHTVDSQFLWLGGLPGDSPQGPSERLLDHRWLLTSTSVWGAGTTRRNSDLTTGNCPPFFPFPSFFIKGKVTKFQLPDSSHLVPS